MKPAAFKYLAPQSVQEAIEQLAHYEGDARVLAGGQSLIALINLRIARPAALIDLGPRRELAYLRREGEWLAIGPMARQREAERSSLIREYCPLMAQTMRHLGPIAVRNRGTVGGTLAHADRTAELPSVAVALGAELVAEGPSGRRVIAADDFFMGDLTTSLRPDEMLREVRLPVATPSGRYAYVEATNRRQDLALVGIAVALELRADGSCHAARLAVIGCGPKPARLRRAEAQLTLGAIDRAAIDEAARISVEDMEFDDDVHASAAYRRRVTPGLVSRAVAAALAQEKGG